MLDDVLPMLVVLGFTALAALLVRTRYPAREFQLFLLSLFGHFVATGLGIWLVYNVYGRGDMLMYHRLSVQITQTLAQDFWATSWQLVLMFLQQDYYLPMLPAGPRSATGSMIAVVAIWHGLLGNSLLAVSFMLATLSWLGKIALFEGITSFFGRQHRTRLLVACALVPSVVFWSGGIVKEGIAMIGVGMCLLAAGRLFTGAARPALFAIAGGGVLLVALMKPHILLAAVLGVGAWVYWRRSTDVHGNVHIRPIYAILGAGVVVAGTMLVGRIFPEFALDAIVEEAAQMQFYGTRASGGSRYTIGNPMDRSLLGQMTYLPLALITALYRPLPFEARNPQMLMNAAETAAFLGATVYTLWKRGPRGTWKIMARWPFLVFLIVFTLSFASGVGLVSNTLGTLSRYRMPMVPFFAAFLLVVTAPLAAPAAARQQSREPWVRPIDRERRASAPQTP